MWLEAIITQEDLVQALDEILPVKIHFDADEKTDRWLVLHRATEVTLVADEGLRVSCSAELTWSFAGLSPTVKLDQLGVLLKPRVVEKKAGHVLEFNIEIEDADLRGVPAFIDSTIVKAVNGSLSEKTLIWNFTETLTRTVGLGKTYEPLEALKIDVAWGKHRITAEAIVLVVSFKLHFVRDELKKENMIMEQTNIAENFERDPIRARAIEQLQSFCRGEMSAVETYNQAIEATHDGRILMRLRRNLASHEARVKLLRGRIMELGGEPPDSSGPWGTFAKAVEGTASALGEKSAVSVLEEGEDHGLADYRADFSNLDLESQRLIADQILPQQVSTHGTLADIKRAMS